MKNINGLLTLSCLTGIILIIIYLNSESKTYLNLGEAYGEVINISGRQRMLSQRLVSNAILYNDASLNKDSINTLIQYDIVDFEEGNKFLGEQNKILNTVKDSPDYVSFEKLFVKNDSLLNSIISSTNFIINEKDSIVLKENLDSLVSTQSHFISNQENITKYYENSLTEAMNTITHQLWMTSIFLVIIIFTLVFSLVYLPMRVRLRIKNQLISQLESQYRDIYTRTPAMLLTLDLDLKIRNISNYWLEKTGHTLKEVINYPVTDFLTTKSRADVLNKFQEFKDAGQCENFYIEFITKNNKVINGLLNLTLERGISEDDLSRILIVSQDITLDNQTNKKLEETEAQLHTIAQNISKLILQVDSDFNVFYTNGNHEFPVQFTLMKNLLEQVNSEYERISLYEELKKCFETAEPGNCSITFTPQFGEHRYFNVNIFPIQNSLGNVFSGVLIFDEITDKIEISVNKANTLLLEKEVRQQNEEIKEYQNEIEHQLQAMNQVAMVSILNTQLKITFTNKKLQQTSGFSAEELLNKPFNFLYLDKDRVAINDIFERLENGIVWEGEVQKMSKEGRTFSVYKTIIPFFNVNKSLEKFVCLSFDITQEKILQEELEEALMKEKELSKLKSHFVSTASHQFRTPLAIIQANSELLRLMTQNIESNQKSKLAIAVKRISTEIRRMTDLMNDVLILGRISDESTVANKYETDIVRLAEELIQQYDDLKTDERELRLEVKGNPKPIMVDTKMLRHAYSNLISNAIKYSDSEVLCQIIFEPKEVVIKVSDKGIGIPDQDIPQLFQPFQRAGNTDGVQGTGLGLSIVKEYIELNGGTVDVTTKENEGSTFHITLPIE